MVQLLTISFSLRKKHLFVLADGSAFYAVALLDLLSHIIPVARNHLETFRIFDIVIGEYPRLCDQLTPHLASVSCIIICTHIALYLLSFFLRSIIFLPHPSRDPTRHHKICIVDFNTRHHRHGRARIIPRYWLSCVV